MYLISFTASEILYEQHSAGCSKGSLNLSFGLDFKLYILHFKDLKFNAEQFSVMMSNQKRQKTCNMGKRHQIWQQTGDNKNRFLELPRPLAGS